MSESKDSKEIRIQSLTQAFESLNKNGRWILTTQFYKDLVRALGVLDVRRVELSKITNHNAKLLDQVIEHTGMEIKHDDQEDTIPDGEAEKEENSEE